MSISKKILLVSLIASSSFYATSQTVVVCSPAKPSEITKMNITREATASEMILAELNAEKQVYNFYKPGFQVFGEGLMKEMTYLYNAEPFGIKHGVVIGAVTVAAIVGAYKLYQKRSGASEETAEPAIDQE